MLDRKLRQWRNDMETYGASAIEIQAIEHEINAVTVISKWPPTEWMEAFAAMWQAGMQFDTWARFTTEEWSMMPFCVVSSSPSTGAVRFMRVINNMGLEKT